MECRCPDAMGCRILLQRTLIEGQVYVCGGILGDAGNGGTVNTCAKYDPQSNSWTLLANMINGRNHAASGTDGSRLFVFGGRGPGSGNNNAVADGFADVQVYDPETDSWESSNEPDSDLEPLPQARGGTGNAVFHQGRFYVMGGETADGDGATPTNTYDRVDIYDPVTNTWRVGPPMPVGVHGIFPALDQGRILVAGGGTSAGFSLSDVLQVYSSNVVGEPSQDCPADLDDSATVDVGDLIELLTAWGPCSPDGSSCPADLDGDGQIAVLDLLSVILDWGPCP